MDEVIGRHRIKHVLNGRVNRAHYTHLTAKEFNGVAGYEYYLITPSGGKCLCWRAGAKEAIIERLEATIERIGVFKVRRWANPPAAQPVALDLVDLKKSMDKPPDYAIGKLSEPE